MRKHPACEECEKNQQERRFKGVDRYERPMVDRARIKTPKKRRK